MVVGERFLFVENPKAASSSIRAALAPFGEPIFSKHDIIWNHQQVPNRRWRAVVVRNPFDRLVSGYHHNKRSARDHGRPFNDFDTWLMGDPWRSGPAGVDFKRTSQLFWTHRTNFLMRFETLEEDFQNLCEILNISATLPSLNATQDRRSYRDYYTEEARRIVEDRFAADLQTYRYVF